MVRSIPLHEARHIIEQQEPMCGATTLAYGLFIGNTLASVVVFGVASSSNLSPRYSETIALLRGVTLPWAPRNCGSKLIRSQGWDGLFDQLVCADHDGHRKGKAQRFCYPIIDDQLKGAGLLNRNV